MSLDGSRQHHVGSSRYSSASPSFHNEPDDFRTRLNRLSLQSSSSASPLARSSSLRSRPGGGVADVGLGRRSTILDGSVRSVRTGYDIDKRDTALPRRDSPYRPSTSYARHSEHYGLQDTMNGQHGSPSERRYLRASPVTSRSHRSSAYSSSTDISRQGRLLLPHLLLLMDTIRPSFVKLTVTTIGAAAGMRRTSCYRVGMHTGRPGTRATVAAQAGAYRTAQSETLAVRTMTP
jgi:hypothetical protein